MAEKIEFELVSPVQLLISQSAEMVVVPGGEGYFGVLRLHLPMITTVKPGVIEIHDNGRIVDLIFVGGGFCEVIRTRITVLVDEAIKVRDLDREQVEKTVKNLEEDLEDAETPSEKAAAEARLNNARAKIEALDRFAGPLAGIMPS